MTYPRYKILGSAVFAELEVWCSDGSSRVALPKERQE